MSGNMFQIANQFNLEAARVGFHAAFMQQLQMLQDDPVGELWVQMPSDGSAELLNWMGDVPGFEKWNGDRRLADLSAFGLLIKNEDWSSGFRAHQNQFKDDKLALFPISVKMLAENAKLHRFDIAVQLLLNGFNGSVFPVIGNGLSYDGAFMFSNSHSSDGGPPQSNYLGPTPLTVASLEAAEAKLGNLKTADGRQPLYIRGTHLLVGPNLEATAKRIVGAGVIANAAGTAAETNIHIGQYKVVVSPRISGPQGNNWFLSDLRRAIRPVIFQLREEISTSAIVGNQGGENDSTQRFQRGELWFGAEARYNVAPFAWQTIIGANPPVN